MFCARGVHFLLGWLVNIVNFKREGLQKVRCPKHFLKKNTVKHDKRARRHPTVKHCFFEKVS